MAQLRRLLGVVVLLLGILVLALSFAGFSTTAATLPPPKSNSQAEYPPNILGSGTFTLSWSGAPSATVVTIYSCPDATCDHAPYLFSQLTQLAQGQGASGSVSTTVQGGHDYILVENGSASGLAIQEAQTGLTYLGIIGIVVAVLGVVLIALPVRSRSKVEEEPEEEVPETVLAPPPKVEMVETPVPVYRPPTGATQAAPEVPMSSVGSGSAPSTVMGGSSGKGRAAITCANCGTLNEPWLTNCRTCKRTLSVSKTPT